HEEGRSWRRQEGAAEEDEKEEAGGRAVVLDEAVRCSGVADIEQLSLEQTPVVRVGDRLPDLLHLVDEECARPLAVEGVGSGQRGERFEEHAELVPSRPVIAAGARDTWTAAEHVEEEPFETYLRLAQDLPRRCRKGFVELRAGALDPEPSHRRRR